jgi:DNA polymerase III subunit epsilon
MYLFFDTETTGLPRDWRAPVTALSNWPRLVQLAWLLYEKDGKLLSDGNYIIRPDGFTIPTAASSIHGITTEKALAHGAELQKVLQDFVKLLMTSKYLVAHNMSFDENIVGAELLRTGMKNHLDAKKKICTMKETTHYCGIDGPYGKKWPKLTELHNKVFGENFPDAHDASIDIKITAKCFWELRKRKVLFYDI